MLLRLVVLVGSQHALQVVDGLQAIGKIYMKPDRALGSYRLPCSTMTFLLMSVLTEYTEREETESREKAKHKKREATEFLRNTQQRRNCGLQQSRTLLESTRARQRLRWQRLYASLPADIATSESSAPSFIYHCKQRKHDENARRKKT